MITEQVIIIDNNNNDYYYNYGAALISFGATEEVEFEGAGETILG